MAPRTVPSAGVHHDPFWAGISPVGGGHWQPIGRTARYQPRRPGCVIPIRLEVDTQKASSPFLKKRTKKLLSPRICGVLASPDAPKPLDLRRSKSFLLLFFKKEGFASLHRVNLNTDWYYSPSKAHPAPIIEDEAAAEAQALAAANAVAEADPRRVPHEEVRAWLLRLANGEFDAPPLQPR